MKIPNCNLEVNRFLIVMVLFTVFFRAEANNIQVRNVTLASQNTTQDFYMIELDLSWENSWRTSTFESNWDAAWVFVKWTPINQQAWLHCDLHYVDGFNDGHVAATGSVIETKNNGAGVNGIGVMIYRNADGIGDVSFQNIQLRWDYGDNGVGDDDLIEISVHAIEMVYVPQGAFYVGDGQQDFGQFEAGTTGQPKLINSEASLTLGGGSANSLGNNNASNMLANDDFDDVASQTLPAAFPKGFDAFYCMKYEASQEQYAQFLAHLTTEQKADRDGPYYVNAVNVFPIEDGNHYAIADHPYRAMDYLSWADIAAYLDWSGLRPISELEFEKACRGPMPAKLNELAWGNDSWYIEGLYTLKDEGTEVETIISGMGTNLGNANTNSIYSGFPSPVRCGIFAASAKNKTREETGATYWGIMEMSGNCYEFMISVGNAQSRDFSGTHGDGFVTGTGNASFSNLLDWAFASAVGIGYRSSEISTRYGANYSNPDREKWHGIRGVRSDN